VTFLTQPQRRAVLDKVLTLVETKFSGPDVNVRQIRDVHETRVLNSETPEDFEQALNGLLQDLKTSHTGLFHEARPRSAGRIAMAATLTKAHTTVDGQRWVFQDVHPGGVAAAVGIESGDVLLSVNDQELIPPAATPFRLGESYTLTVRKPDGSTTHSILAIPGSREKKRPIVVPDQVVSARKLDSDVGYIRVSMFPGVLGMDVARDISRAVAELGCDRLVVDLRGNTGGGIGCLRLMSHLCADRRGVGYSVGRKLARSGYDKNRLAPLFVDIKPLIDVALRQDPAQRQQFEQFARIFPIDKPFKKKAGIAVIYQEFSAFVKTSLSIAMIARLRVIDAEGAERLAGEYTFHHTRTITGPAGWKSL